MEIAGGRFAVETADTLEEELSHSLNLGGRTRGKRIHVRPPTLRVGIHDDNISMYTPPRAQTINTRYVICCSLICYCLLLCFHGQTDDGSTSVDMQFRDRRQPCVPRFLAAATYAAHIVKGQAHYDWGFPRSEIDRRLYCIFTTHLHSTRYFYLLFLSFPS